LTSRLDFLEKIPEAFKNVLDSLIINTVFIFDTFGGKFTGMFGNDRIVIADTVGREVGLYALIADGILIFPGEERYLQYDSEKYPVQHQHHKRCYEYAAAQDKAQTCACLYGFPPLSFFRRHHANLSNNDT